jgi:hypothetical protein
VAEGLKLVLWADDGAVVYLNGKEVAWNNLRAISRTASI